MAWARIDDNFFNHPKIRRAGRNAVCFHIAALCFSNAYLTEGFIASEMIELIGTQAFQPNARALVDRLVECRLWEKAEGGYRIHDFLDYNHSRAEVEQIRQKRSQAGKAGGRTRARSNQADRSADAKQNESNPETSAGADANQNPGAASAIPIPSPIPSPEPLPTGTTTAGEPDALAEMFRCYESEIGLVSAFIAEALRSAAADYPPEWISAAIHEAARNNKRNWGYVHSILKRWKAEGFQTDTRAKHSAAKAAPRKTDGAGLTDELDALIAGEKTRGAA